MTTPTGPEGEKARQALGIDGTAGDAQDVDHPFRAGGPGWCIVCGMARDWKRHDAGPRDLPPKDQE